MDLYLSKVHVGANIQHYYGDMSYTTDKSRKVAVIAGCTVGAVVIIIIIVLSVVCSRRRQRKKTHETTQNQPEHAEATSGRIELAPVVMDSDMEMAGKSSGVHT